MCGGRSSSREGSPLSVERYTSSRALPVVEWDQLTAGATPLLSRAQLQAFERAEGGEERHLITLRRAGQLVAAALLHTAPFHGPSIAEIIQARAPRSAWALRQLRLGVSPLDARLLICGGSAASQGPALYICPSVARAEALEVIGAEAQAIMRASSGPRPILAVLFQGAPELGALAGLTEVGFTRFESDPSLALTLDPSWAHFDDYLASLTSKYRVKAKRADALSAELEQVTLDAEGARAWREALHSTYGQVTQRASFCVRATELDALPELLEAQPERYHLSAYLARGELIGFRLSVREGDTLYAQLVGIDYDQNRTFGLYPRILNDYLREGLERGCRVVDLGRTAGEIKSTLGATPSATELYLTHAHPLMDWALPSISKRVTPAAHKQHKPFKS